MTLRRLKHQRREPLQFGDPTPEGRKAGDCHMCQGVPAFCDCQLSQTTEPGKIAWWEINTGSLGKR